MDVRAILLILLGILTLVYMVVWGSAMARRAGFVLPTWLETFIGFITNFFDTLGIGSFAPTTSMFKFWKIVPDEKIPGTLNIGHTLPTVAEALIFIAAVAVAPKTLILLILAAVVGAWLGAGVVARWPRRNIQVGMGIALLCAAAIFIMQNPKINLMPGGGAALGLEGAKLGIGIVGSFILGALMTLGIGLYAPCMIMISLLGMNPKAAFPIMMGACAFLMPVASFRFIRFNAYTVRAAIGLAIGGVPAVLIAAYIVKSLPLDWIRWLVVIVVIYAATAMLRSAIQERGLAREDLAVAPGEVH